jgi:uncharacterized alkaline shock family protein YloU
MTEQAPTGPGAETAGDVAAAGRPDLSVGRSVIVEVARQAALEVPEVLRVGRGGPAWRAWLVGPAITVRVRGDTVSVRLRVIARPGADLVAAAARIRAAVAASVERLLGLKVGDVTVLVDGIGS